MATTTNEFEKPLLWRRQPPGEKFPVGEFDAASEVVKALMMENHNTGAVVFIDRLGWARMAAIPSAQQAGGGYGADRCKH